MQHSPKSYTKTVKALASASVSATQTGTGQDCSGWRFLKAILCVDAIAATATMDVKLQECATVGGTYTDIPGAVFTQVATGNTTVDRFLEVFLQQRLQFIRVLATYGGSSTAVIGCRFELSGPRQAAALATNAYDAQVS